jgi:large subunit ribosomal protein L3
MNAMRTGLIAQKMGMTRVFAEDGRHVPVTVLWVGGCQVVAHKTAERDGYTALQLGFDEQKPTRMTKADLGRFKAANASPRKFVREFRVEPSELEKFPIGSEVPLDVFKEGQYVDVLGTSKGKGFQGVMKRHKLGGKPNTHGVHEYFRHGGSIGCRLTPGRVHPGKRMGGQMGNVKLTAQNLLVAKSLAEHGVLLVRGTVPGANGGYVVVHAARKVSIRKGHGTEKREKT